MDFQCPFGWRLAEGAEGMRDWSFHVAFEALDFFYVCYAHYTYIRFKNMCKQLGEV